MCLAYLKVSPSNMTAKYRFFSFMDENGTHRYVLFAKKRNQPTEEQK